ncbi:MAG: hypothetical protein MJ172_08675 [Clostridia bacterium]|nr:hypothetical protein [Clostridia bacterium]
MGLLEFSFLFFLCTVMLKAAVMFEEGIRLTDEEARIIRQQALAEARFNKACAEIRANKAKNINSNNNVRRANVNRARKVTRIPANNTSRKPVHVTGRTVRKAA